MSEDEGLVELATIISCADRAEAYLQLVSLFMAGTQATRDEVSRRWDFGVDWVYPDATRIACSVGELHSSYERSVACLAYHAIAEMEQRDYREDLLDLAIVYNACLAAGLDPKRVFDEVAAVASERVALLLGQFIGRSPEDKSLEAFLLEATRNADGEVEIKPSL